LVFSFIWASISEANGSLLVELRFKPLNTDHVHQFLGLWTYNRQEYNVTCSVHRSVFRGTSLNIFMNVPR
jgi:hypothetical protein